MSGADSSPKMSIKERIAALQKQGNGDAPPSLTKPKMNKSNGLSSRIAALQKNVEVKSDVGEEASKAEKPKVGKLKLPAGAVPVMSFGAGPPPSLLKKQKEREERMTKLQQEAVSTGHEEEVDKPKVGKLKLPAGAVPIIPFGAGPPPSLLKKQKEREERMAKLQQEAASTGDEEQLGKPKFGKLKPPVGAVPIMSFGAGPPPSLLKKQKEREERMAKLQQEAASTSEPADVNVEDALLSRPTMKGKRRPRTRS